MKFILPLNQEEIRDIVEFAEFLSEVRELQPGRHARGVAVFPPEPTHFQSNPIVKASRLQQVCFELAELVCKSRQEIGEKRFLVVDSKFAIRRFVPQFVPFNLNVDVKMNTECTHGTCEVNGYLDENCKILAVAGRFIFLLKRVSDKAVLV